MPERKVRFTITANSQTSELFSVQEKISTDLIINIKRSDQYSHGALNQDFSEARESRITIHNSPNSKGITINYHTFTELMGKVTHSSFVTPRHGKLLWPIIAVHAPDIEKDTYLPNVRKNDSIVNLGWYNPTSQSLCYAIVVSDKNNELGISGFSQLLYDFSSFRIYVFYRYMCSTSFHQGGIATFATAEPTVNGSKGEIVFPDARSYRMGQLRDCLLYIFNKFGENNADRLIRYFEKENVDTPKELVESIRELSLKFTASPIKNK